MRHALVGKQRRLVASGGSSATAPFLAGLDAHAAADHLHFHEEHIESFIWGSEPDRHEVEAPAVGARRDALTGNHGH